MWQKHNKSCEGEEVFILPDRPDIHKQSLSSIVGAELLRQFG